MARRGRSSWLSALIGLAGLAAVSFLVGALAGFVWKEPGLLVAYLTGDTEEVAWSSVSEEVVEAPLPVAAGSEAGSAAPVRVAAASPERASAPQPKPAAPKPKPAPEARSTPSALPQVAAAPPGRASIAVQVGAFGERSAADRLRSSLAEAGFPAYLAAGAVAGEPWRVRVGPYPDRAQAEQIAGRLKRDQKLPTWVLDENGE